MITSQPTDQTLTFLRHSSLDLPITIKICTLEGTRPQASLLALLDHPPLKHSGVQQHSPPDIYVIIQLFGNGQMLSLPYQTSHKSFGNAGISWNETITLPLKYRDLSRDAQLVVTVYDIAGPRQIEVVGGSTLSLFGKKSTLKKGKQRLFLHAGVTGDGSISTSTPSKVGLKDEMGRLEKLVKKFERGDIGRLDWLDKITFRNIEKIHSVESQKSENLFLYIDIPRFDFPVVFSEPEYSAPITTTTRLPTSNSSNTTTSPNIVPFSLSGLNDVNLFSIIDPEVTRDNPVEAKHRRLVRSHRNGPLDRELKPNAKFRDELNEILRYPPTQILTNLQRDLIWQFRFYLTRDKRALTKFLKSVVWSDLVEVKQAIEILLPMWVQVDMDDALELLGPVADFKDERVRGFAVGVLGRADDEELMLYLLQLVQALKFETISTSTTKSTSSSTLRTSRSMIASRLVSSSGTTNSVLSLENFLIERSAKNYVLGNNFYWYLIVECDSKGFGDFYNKIKDKFLNRIYETQLDSEPNRLDLLNRQTEFIRKIAKLALELRLSKESRLKKIERLHSILKDSKQGLGNFKAIPLPLDASISIVGIQVEESSIFKSNLFPLKLSLITTAGSNYPIIFKSGDDLRQDQLVIQLFTLMNNLLQKENLNLKLITYKVLATGNVQGAVQFIPAQTLQNIIGEHGTLLNYLRVEGGGGSADTYGVNKTVFDTFVRSCAGSCIVTYLLGVGDRHLDNLLLTPTGNFFHVDFGYILNRDPKPFPPAIKVCKEMIEALGGVDSIHYTRFKSLCFIGFLCLRKNSGLILNLVGLMVQGGIGDIALEPDKAVGKVQDKFLLDLSEQDAIKAFEVLLNETSYFGTVLDVIHSVAQYYRA